MGAWQNQQDGTVVRGTPDVTETANFMSRVYLWMMIGVFLTGIVSYSVASNPVWASAIFSHPPIFWGLVIAQLLAVIVLSALIEKMNVALAGFIFLGYAALTGVTLSIIFLAYTQQSIASAFIVTTASFAGLSVFGYMTKRDLGPIGAFCIMGLFGIIAISILSFFVHSLMSNTVQMAISAAGVLIFSGLTAYDTQKIKLLNARIGNNTAIAKKEAIHGALMLYLDFINLFLSILRLMGRRR